MEFQYRAGDERRSRSPPPPTPAAPSTSRSGSADVHGGDGAALVLRKPPTPPPADSADELRRQAEKAKIRERILREEAEHWELELEVRREIREQLLRLSWPALGRSAAGPPVPGIGAGNASLHVAYHEDHPIAKVPAASPVKRKSPDRGAASTVSAATSSKKQKINPTCMVCGISATSEKAMQDHLNGKVHKRKATALLELPKAMAQPETETWHETREEVLAPSRDYTPSKLTMLTNAGALNEVIQMDGYLLCDVCNVRTIDRVTMMCHLEGSKHISKGQKKGQGFSKPLDEALKKGGKGTSVQEAATAVMVSADPETLIPELYGVPHTVRRMEAGFLLCELCNVKVPSINGIQHHLSGKKHKNKAKARSDASINVPTAGVNEAAKAQPMETDTGVIAGMAVQVKAPLAKSLEAKVGDDSEVQETTATSTKDVISGDSNNIHAKKVRNASASAAPENNVHNSDSLTMEVDSVHHPLQRVDGFLLCPCCNVKAPSEIVMRSHLSGKKHKHKMALAARVNNKDASILSTGADEVQGSSSKSMKTNVEAESVTLPVTREKSVAAMTPMDVHSPTEFNPAVGIEHGEGGMITRVHGSSSNLVKVDRESESVMPLGTQQVKNAAAMAPMEVDGTTEVQPAICKKRVEDGRITQVQSSPESLKANEEAESAPSLTITTKVDGPTEAQPATRIEGEYTDATTQVSTTHMGTSVKDDNVVPGMPIKIQVEGEVFTVLQEQNGRLSCEPCGVHGCNKDGMIQHLYTRTHWDRANPAEKKKEQEAAAVVVDSDGN